MSQKNRATALVPAVTFTTLYDITFNLRKKLKITTKNIKIEFETLLEYFDSHTVVIQ